MYLWNPLEKRDRRQWILNNVLSKKDGVSVSEGKTYDITEFIDEVLHQNLKRK